MWCEIDPILDELPSLVKFPAASETYVYKGQVADEEVHGCVEVGIWANGQDDEQISKHSDQIHGEENPKYEGLQFWFLWKAQEKKFWNSCIISWFHVV